VTTTVHDHPDNSEPDSPELSLLYDDFKREHLTPLWTQVDDLMPMQPTPRALRRHRFPGQHLRGR
jgi:gentisate 1,2-dioxygenase